MAKMAALTRDELLALLKAAKKHSERDWLLLLVTFSHGLRASEAIHLTRANFKDRRLTINRLKGSERTCQPLLSNDNELLDERGGLEKYLATLAPRERLFKITRHGYTWIMRRHCHTAGISEHKSHPHSLKHTCAILTIKTAGIENVRIYLGHVSIASTGQYLKVPEEQAAKAVAAAMSF